MSDIETPEASEEQEPEAIEIGGIDAEDDNYTAPVSGVECPVCGKTFKHNGALGGHMRGGHKEAGESAPSTLGSPAILPEWRRNPYLSTLLRGITMLDPRCKVCQNEENAGSGWYKRCPHDPYVTVAEVPDPRPKYEDDPENPGRRIVTGIEQGVRYVMIPNTRDITLSAGSMSHLGVVNARRKGFILPSELRSPSFPNGIAEACQYSDCKYQQGLEEFHIGNDIRGSFCRKEEAQLVWFGETGTTVPIGWDERSRAFRDQELAKAQTG